jgi:hypothetical protein
MTHFAKPDEIAKLSTHPEAQLVEGTSGLSYLTVPENIINEEAQKHFCPIRNSIEFRRVLVVPVASDGISLNTTYEG